MESLQVPFSDPSVLVCVKPAGCLAEAGPGANLPSLASAYLAENKLPDEVFTVHRLDREVSGLTVLARSHEAASDLISQFSEHRVEKEYFAVLKGTPAEARAVLEDLLFRDAKRNKSYVVTRERKGVRRAKLEYRLLAEGADGAQPVSLVRIRLFTGRTHQIRVQFASRKLPLLGDGRYGGRDARCNIALFSCLLAFDHPKTRRRLRFYQAPDRDAFPWNLFPKDTYTSISPFSAHDT